MEEKPEIMPNAEIDDDEEVEVAEKEIIPEDNVTEENQSTPPPASPVSPTGDLSQAEIEEMKANLFEKDAQVESGNVMRVIVCQTTVKGKGFDELHVAYPLVVQTNMELYSTCSPFIRDGLYTWLVFTRYSSVLKLRSILSETKSLPELPPKNKVGKFKDEVTDIRKASFEEIFNAICEDDEILKTEPMVRFLWPQMKVELYQPFLEAALLDIILAKRAKTAAAQEAGKTAGRFVLKEVLKKAGENIIPFVGGAIDGGFEYYDHRQKNRAVAVGAGSAAGGVVGTMIGMSIFSVVGGFVGGAMGSTLGGMGAKRAVKLRPNLEGIPLNPFDELKKDTDDDDATTATNKEN